MLKCGFLESSEYLQSLSQYDKPWVPEEMKNPSKKMPAKKVSVVPLKGAEFIMPATGFWCSLCKVLLGDQSCGEFHLKTDQHHDNYKAFIKENPFHEQRRNLDKATALSQKKEEHLKQEAQKKFELNKAQKKIDERIKSKVRSSEKEVKELDDLNEDQTKCSSLTRKQLAIRKSSKEQTEVKGDQESELKKAVDEAKKAIEVKLYAKKVNVPGKNPTLQPSGKSIPTITHGKRNPVLPPWNPVSLSKTNTGSVVGEKKLVTAEDILKAFTGKTKAAEKEKEDEELKKKKEEERKLIEDAKKNEEMMKQQSSENVATTCQNVLPLKPRPAKYDWEKPKSVPILSVSKASLEVGTNSQSQKIQNTSSGSTEAVNPIATVAIPLPETITQTVASNKEQNIVKNKINENSKNNSTESEVKQTNLCSDNITESCKIEAQSHDKILEEENVKHTGSSQNKVGELVEISNDSSSNDSVVVPMENLDIPKTLVPAAPPPAQDTEMVMVVADIHSDEESVASSISMHMGSDFEVIDDLEQP